MIAPIEQAPPGESIPAPEFMGLFRSLVYYGDKMGDTIKDGQRMVLFQVPVSSMEPGGLYVIHIRTDLYTIAGRCHSNTPETVVLSFDGHDPWHPIKCHFEPQDWKKQDISSVYAVVKIFPLPESGLM